MDPFILLALLGPIGGGIGYILGRQERIGPAKIVTIEAPKSQNGWHTHDWVLRSTESTSGFQRKIFVCRENEVHRMVMSSRESMD